MKKLFKPFVYLLASAVVFAAFVTAFPPSADIAAAVQVPQELNLAIGVGITALMTAGAVFLFSKIGLDLQQFATPVASSISIYVVIELQNVVNTIPEIYDPWLNLLFKILVVLLGSVGALYLVNKPKGGPPYQYQLV